MNLCIGHNLFYKKIILTNTLLNIFTDLILLFENCWYFKTNKTIKTNKTSSTLSLIFDPEASSVSQNFGLYSNCVASDKTNNIHIYSLSNIYQAPFLTNNLLYLKQCCQCLNRSLEFQILFLRKCKMKFLVCRKRI